MAARGTRRILTAVATLALVALAVGVIVRALPGRGVAVSTVPVSADATPIAPVVAVLPSPRFDGAPAVAPPSVPTVASPPAMPSFEAAYRAGIDAFRRGDAHAAAKAFEEARTINPHSADVYANLGFAYVEMARGVEAVEVFQRAIDILPRQINAYYGLGEAHELAGDRAAAMGAMRTFVHLAPENDPFRRRAMAALWEWETTSAPKTPANQATPADAPLVAMANPDDVRQMNPPVLAGTVVPLARFSGRMIVLNIWATWCPPCRAELPALQKLADALDPATAVVAGLSIDREKVFAGEFVREMGVTFPMYWDEGDRIARKHLGLSTYPTTLILAPDGRELARIVGLRVWDSPDVIAAMQELAAGHAPTEARIARLEVFP